MTDTRCVNERLREVLAIHFDPGGGTPYWLEQVERLGFSPPQEIRGVDDLHRFGLMDPDAMRRRPLIDFIPRSLRASVRQLVIAQTGGTLGGPIWTAYFEDEFSQAFVDPFVMAARHVGFPMGGLWLYVGPSGPHIIGRAADAIARATGSPSAFTVDFDPRWAAKLDAGSFAARRYLDHVVHQALDVIRVQPITTLFTTPPILSALAGAMTESQRRGINGIHYGGTALEPATLGRFQAELFPEAVHLSGYGNTLFGCCLELTTQPHREPAYFPHGPRLLFGVLSEGPLHEPVISYNRVGVRGRLLFSRLDRTVLLINHVERDEGCLAGPPATAPPGFICCGVAGPSPARAIPLAGSSAALY